MAAVRCVGLIRIKQRRAEHTLGFAGILSDDIGGRVERSSWRFLSRSFFPFLLFGHTQHRKQRDRTVNRNVQSSLYVRASLQVQVPTNLKFAAPWTLSLSLSVSRLSAGNMPGSCAVDAGGPPGTRAHGENGHAVEASLVRQEFGRCQPRHAFPFLQPEAVVHS